MKKTKKFKHYKELSIKQQLFVRYYLSTLKKCEAALLAGYNKNSAAVSASLNLKNPLIQQEIKKVTDEKLKEAGATFEWKIKTLVDLVNRCVEGKNMKGGFTQPTGAISAIAELNKMMGHYKQGDEGQVLSAQQEKEIENIIQKYKKEY